MEQIETTSFGIEITPGGVKKALKKYDFKKAIAEFIWNGFDAEATVVNLVYKVDEIGAISQIQVVDNGYGIDNGKIAEKFKPFYESDKEIDPDFQRNTSITHGKNGVGRLTFFTFAHEASWETIYRSSNDLNFTYTIYVNSNTINAYESSVPSLSGNSTGTTVSFRGIRPIAEQTFRSDVKAYLIQEFCWYLELNKRKGYTILINGEPLDYSSNVGEHELFTFGENPTFEVDYVRWDKNINNEFSRYYYIDEYDEERFKETTKLNNQGDKFYHSIYIRSSYFNGVPRPTNIVKEDDTQIDPLGFKRTEKFFKNLMDHITSFLRAKRKPFLAASTNKFMEQFKRQGAFPHYGQSEWDRVRRYQLEQTVKAIYQFEPKVFSSLNIEQRKVITHLLDLIIDADEKDRLIDIISEIVNLTKTERAEFANLLNVSKMSSIIKMTRLVHDRYRAVDQLKQLVFDRALKANEVTHVQGFIEQHYWIFGEQFHLVTAAEPKFEEALRRYIYLLRGEDAPTTINHPDKQKEMDIFMVRQLVNHDKVNCVVVELKSPTVLLGEKELRQVKQYWGVIRNQAEFNAPNNTWEFYLVGNRFDTSGYIEGEIESARHHGEQSLVYATSNCKIYVKTWSQIFTEFDIRHKFLLDKLDPERKHLHTPATSANGVVNEAKNSTAAMPGQVIVPSM